MTRRKIIFFATAAGTGLSSGSGQTHGGATKIPTPEWTKHWGIMVGSDQEDMNATMFEMRKGSMLKNLVKGDHEFETPIWPEIRGRGERQHEEWNESQLKFRDTGLTTLHDDNTIEQYARDVCNRNMVGSYNIRYRNCQTMVSELIKVIKDEDKDFDPPDLLSHTI